MQFLVSCKGIDRLLSRYLEAFDVFKEFACRSAFDSYIRPMGQHVDSADLTALEAALLSEEAHDIASTYLVLLAFTYI